MVEIRIPAFSILFPVALSLAASVASAQIAEPAQRSMDRWQPGFDSEAVLSVDSAHMPLSPGYDLWVTAGYAHNLLLVTDPNAHSTGALLGSRLFSHLGGSYLLLPWLEAGANLPLVLYQARGASPSAAFGPVGSLASAGLGDLNLRAKLAPPFLQNDWVDLALLAAIGLPTHTPREAYLGDSPVTLFGGVAASRRLFNFDLSADLGYFWRPAVHFLNATIGPEVRAGFAARYDLDALTSLPLTAEATWTVVARHGAPFKRINETPSELLFGAVYRGWSPLLVSAAAGFGLLAGVGTPAVRFLVDVRWSVHPGDRDHDRIPDSEDRCPDQPEDRDGFQDEDGCPDPDNDSDGIEDAQDECPNEPETLNGVDDEDGCPDSAVSIKGSHLSLKDSVHFEVDKAILKQKSRLLLNEVAELLKANPQIKKVRIEGHTDSDGGEEHNLSLSRARADAVKDYLISRGIDAARLEAEGFGESRPLAPNTTAKGKALNRRVDFLIVEPKTEPAPAPTPAPTPARPAAK